MIWCGISVAGKDVDMQKYRFDKDGDPCKNGAVPVYAHWMGGPSLAGIRNCPTNVEGVRRTVYILGEPDTFFSIPAACRMFGQRVKGYVGTDEEGFFFQVTRADNV